MLKRTSNNILSTLLHAVLVVGSPWYRVWRPSRLGRGGCIAAAFIIAAIVVLGTSCVPGGDTSPQQSTRIALIDLSYSTAEVSQSDPTIQSAQSVYRTQFEKDTREFASECAKQQQHCTLIVILFAGDPWAEAQIERFNFSSDRQGDFPAADLQYDAGAAIKKVEDLMDHPPITHLDSTSLLEALEIADQEAGKANRPLDLIVYSDGVENSEALNMYSSKLDEADINSTLDQLQANGQIPVNLRHTSIRFPFVDVHFEGSQVDHAKLTAFWTAWAKLAGADLDLTRGDTLPGQP